MGQKFNPYEGIKICTSTGKSKHVFSTSPFSETELFSLCVNLLTANINSLILVHELLFVALYNFVHSSYLKLSQIFSFYDSAFSQFLTHIYILAEINFPQALPDFSSSTIQVDILHYYLIPLFIPLFTRSLVSSVATG